MEFIPGKRLSDILARMPTRDERVKWYQEYIASLGNLDLLQALFLCGRNDSGYYYYNETQDEVLRRMNGS